MNKTKIKKSNKKNKKYMIETDSGPVHFGDKRYEQFEDTTGLGLYSNLNHKDKKRKDSYCSRAMGIKNKKNEFTYNDPASANYYSVRLLWGCL
tara:strand:- start:227 stop:505 length:279 start_codon:yes stop_codon:yes gene_type:complete